MNLQTGSRRGNDQTRLRCCPSCTKPPLPLTTKPGAGLQGQWWRWFVDFIFDNTSWCGTQSMRDEVVVAV